MNDDGTQEPERRSNRKKQLTFKAGGPEPFSSPTTKSQNTHDKVEDSRMPDRVLGKRRSRPSPSHQPSGIFSPSVFKIYDWPYPMPTDFVNLPERQRAWKRRTDDGQKAADVDDGSDNWYEFDDEENKRVIGRTFLNRAKRAFWAGKKWLDFVEEERNGYSENVARQQGPILLSNKLRMAVFHELAERLCEEIWSERYQELPGLVRLRVGESRPRADSAHPTPEWTTPTAPTTRQTLPPTAEEAARGIIGWSLDPDGFRQPFYEGETGAPNGIAETMREMHADGLLPFPANRFSAPAEPRTKNTRAEHPLDAYERHVREAEAAKTPSFRIKRTALEEAVAGIDMETSDEDGSPKRQPIWQHRLEE